VEWRFVPHQSRRRQEGLFGNEPEAPLERDRVTTFTTFLALIAVRQGKTESSRAE
jgi:hypothetical protein